jgi:hypothetical protein
MTLSVLDFPFCFLLVRSVGTERIGEFLFLSFFLERRDGGGMGEETRW